jgi:integrase/recombinase XerC
MEHWLSHERALKSAADNTLSAYATDVAGFVAFMAQHRGGRQGLSSLAAIATRDMRAWMAHERSLRSEQPQFGARAFRRLKRSSVGSPERHALEPTAVLLARAPKFERKLPRPLAEDAAHDMIETVEFQAQEDWIAARDAAVLTLLYGCGLRISEALGLTRADHPLPDVLRITGKGGKQRLVPVLPVAQGCCSAIYGALPFSYWSERPDIPRQTRRGIGAGIGAKIHAHGANAIGAAGKRDPPRPTPLLCHTSAQRRR